jgi:hypothetical protein
MLQVWLLGDGGNQRLVSACINAACMPNVQWPMVDVNLSICVSQSWTVLITLSTFRCEVYEYQWCKCSHLCSRLI